MTTKFQSWGPLATPVFETAAIPKLRPGENPWKDNAYFSVWDPERELFGVIHFSTSPDGGGRRARCSLSARNRTCEVIEPLGPGTFNSESITLDLDGRITVNHPAMKVDLTLQPRSGPIDFATQPLHALSDDSPLQHWEQSIRVTGPISIGDEHHLVDGLGFRDRTFGRRDESAQWVEYSWIIATFNDFDLTVGKLRGADGSEKVHGFRVTPDRHTAATGITVQRDASGMYRSGASSFETGPGLEVIHSTRRAGFWVPMGPDDQSGPVFSAYDEFVVLRTAEGATGCGIVEHGILRHVR